MRNKNIQKFIFIVLIILLTFSGCNEDTSTNYESTIVCLGNSLTAGYGAGTSFPLDSSKAYPANLQKKVNRDVINSGVSGITTGGALTRLDSSVQKFDPSIIIIELGANDFFQSIDISLTENNLQEIISYISDGERKIYLAKFYTEDVGRAFLDEQRPDLTYEDQTAILADYDEMFTYLEIDYDIELIEDIWAGVWGVHMYSDGIHPNAEGYVIMADNYFNVMESYLEDAGFLN